MQVKHKLVQEYKTYIILFFISLLGFILRYKGITAESLWLDELFSVSFSQPTNLYKDVIETTLQDVHPPLFQTLLWFWFKLFGFTEFVARSFPMLMGTFAIVGIFFLAKELFNEKVGLYSALIISLNIFVIQYSQEVRSYSLLLLLSILSYTFFIRTLKSEGAKQDLILYWVLSILVFYTHYFGFFLILTQFLVFVLYTYKYAKDKKRFLLIGLATVILFVMSLFPIIEYIVANVKMTKFWIEKPSFTFFVFYLRSYFNSKGLFYLFFILSLYSMSFLLRKDTQSKEKAFLWTLVIWVVFGYLFPYLRSITSAPLLTLRNTIIIIPSLVVLTSYGVYKLSNLWLRRLVLIMIVGFSSYSLYFNYYSKYRKDQWREVLFSIKDYKQVPIYSIIPYGVFTNTNHYQIYSKLLSLDLEIKDIDTLVKDNNNKNLPECFWILDAHGEHIRTNLHDNTSKEQDMSFEYIDIEVNGVTKKVLKEIEIDKNSLLQEINFISKQNAKAILFSYDKDNTTCFKDLNF